ncbi:hypothetical protein J8J17_27185, partial [Mycobacterium tuberculosis]|nr:hypothetical protein [Mycobacterium tuberculosis]
AYKKHYLEKVEAYKHYDLLLSISEFARQEALSLLPLEQACVVNVSTAADAIFRPIIQDEAQCKALAAKFKLREPFVL